MFEVEDLWKHWNNPHELNVWVFKVLKLDDIYMEEETDKESSRVSAMLNPFTAMLATLSLWKQPIKVPDLKPLK